VNLAELIKTAVNEHETVFVNADGKVHDRNKTVGGSEGWQCMRKTWYVKNNQPFDGGYVESRGYFIRGHVMEDVVVDLIKKQLDQGVWDYRYTGKDQVTLVDGQVSATPDGLLVNMIDWEEIVVEIKSLDPRSNFDKPKPQHVFQAQQQIELFNRCTAHKPERALLVYIDSADYAHVVQHEVERDPGVLENVEARAHEIFSAPSADLLPAEGKYSDECRYCGFTKACGEAVINHFPSDTTDNLAPELLDEIHDLIDTFNDADSEIKELTKLKGEAQEKIKTFLRQNNLKAVKDDTFTISYNMVAGRKSLDTDALINDGIDLENYYKVGPQSERLTIKVK
jgi:CRISPR/Cas system-associated exonuclease Cas4 (RecB family)